jgi:hypothetical protein
MYGITENIIISDISRIGAMITKTAENVTEGLKGGNHTLFTESMEQLADIDIDTNSINNKIVSAIPIFCKDEKAAREFVSYVKIMDEFAQTTYAVRYFCRNITDCINERCYTVVKDIVLQLFQASMGAFAMSLELIKNSDNIKSIFRTIKTEQIRCDELRAQIERNVAGFDVKLAFSCITIVNISEKIDVISKSAIATAKIIMLTQDGGKLRIY